MPTLLNISVRFSKANGKPCTKRDAARIDEALLNESAELVHGCGYAVNSTLWKTPEVSGGELEVVFEVEVEAYEGETKTAAELCDEVEADVGFFCPEVYEVESICTTFA